MVYKKGKFINAMSHALVSAPITRANTLVIADFAAGKPVAVVKQIVGLIALLDHLRRQAWRYLCASPSGSG